MSTEKDHMEDVFSRRFSGYEEEPSEQAWKGIQEGVGRRKNKRRALVVLFVFIAAASYSTYKIFNKAAMQHESAAAGTAFSAAPEPASVSLNSQPGTGIMHAHVPLAKGKVSKPYANKHDVIVFNVPLYNTASDENSEILQSYEDNKVTGSHIPLFEMPYYKEVSMPAYIPEMYKARAIYSFNRELAKSAEIKKSVLSAISIDAGIAKLSAPGFSEALERSTSLNFHFRISERLKLSAGMGVQQLSSQAFHRYDKPYSYVYDSLLVIDSKRELSYFKLYDTAIATERETFRHTYTSVLLPLSVDYLLSSSKNKLQFSAGAGLQIGKIISGKIYNTEVPGLGSHVKEVRFDEATTFTRSYTAQMSYSISAAYRVGAHTYIMLSPQYRYMLSKSKQVGQSSAAHLSGFGLKASCLYSF